MTYHVAHHLKRRLTIAASAAAVLLCVFTLPNDALAIRSDAMIEGAKMCTRQLPRYEREYGIPVHLLAAIASTESGRWHDGLRISLPWPWTINDGKEGHYYDTKEEAVAAAKRFLASGKTSFDVGCMQVNMHHHKDAFASIEDAFDPETNVRYAASFLRSLYEEDKSWRAASAAYHSRTPMYGSRYVSKVYDRWYTIIDRVRTARATLASATGNVQMARLSTEEMHAAREAQKSQSAPQPVKLTRSDEPQISHLSPLEKTDAIQVEYKPVSVKVIDVSSAARSASRHQDTLVVRPEPEIQVSAGVIPVTNAPAPITVANTSGYAARAAETRQIPTPRVVHPAPAPVQQAQSGPRFIFSD